VARGVKADARLVKIRTPTGDTTVDLTVADFLMLRRINDGQNAEIKNIEKHYTRLKARGLVTHEFSSDRSGFPIALARLTQAGQQALAQQHEPA
jgi:hypothetical protein